MMNGGQVEQSVLRARVEHYLQLYLFDNAVFLVEEILADRAVPFPLAAVKTLPKLVEATLSTRQLAFFCRVLALTVLDAEERGVAAPPSDEFGENVSESMANMLRRDADDEAASITDANQKLLLEMPVRHTSPPPLCALELAQPFLFCRCTEMF